MTRYYKFIIQAFGINKNGKSAIIIEGLNRSFMQFKYLDRTKKSKFIRHLQLKMGNYYDENIKDHKLKKQKLHGLDNIKLPLLFMF